MGQAHPTTPALLLLAVFSRHEDALAWAKAKAEAAWGKVALASAAFDFTETDYYRSTMGDGLKKQFFVFEQLIDPERLVDLKLQTNGWEAEYAAQRRHEESRPLNLDPGYITLAKLVLASTKDHWHRLYLGRGIYGELTLHFRGGRWQTNPWTYPDYCREDFQQFFTECRNYLKGRQHEWAGE